MHRFNSPLRFFQHAALLPCLVRYILLIASLQHATLLLCLARDDYLQRFGMHVHPAWSGSYACVDLEADVRE